MSAASEVEQGRRRKPWMAMEVRGGGGLLVLGGALIAAGLGAAFAARRAHVNDPRRRSSTTRPADEACKVGENLDEGIDCDGEGGQLDEVGGDAVKGLASLLALDPIPSTPSIKLAEDRQGEFLIQSPVETQENMAKPRIDKSPTFENLENSVTTEERMVETDAADGGDGVVQEFSLGGLEAGTVQNQNKKTKAELELVKPEELKEEEEEEEEFSFSNVGFSNIQDKNEQNLEEFRLDFVNAEEEIDGGGGGGEEVPSSEEVEEFSFRAAESDAIHNQIKQTPEESKLVRAGEEGEEEEEEEEEEESNDDVEAPTSESDSQEEETEPSVEEESDREEEGSDNTGTSSPESSAEAVWPAEVIEQEKGSMLLPNHQDIAEESYEEKVTTVKAGKETEEYDQKVAEKGTAAEESAGKKMTTGLKMMEEDSKIGLMPVNYSNRFFLLLLALALVLSLIFAHRYRLYHLHEVFFPSENVM